ncbi:class I adenylate-forming enzyme family protein [Streptomyces sp. SID13588]|uniref:class I adenylate-forming enzyme family protein n=1 Tax=Streptomyces sp. SID13588 TaxID=2706051 RepID=UPI0013CD8014|nr:class I adenylate-forming enzyme family protein [Streptomyces sp. SID13588]NEA73803.1 acyl--CoA ligase [Streptomyces sp. SID13588]
MTGSLGGWAWNGLRPASADDLGIPADLDATTALLTRNIARGLGDAVALRNAGGPALTYRQLDGLVNALALRLPWPRTSRIVLHLGHSVDFVLCFLAVLRAGLVAVPVPSTASLRDAADIIEDAEPTAVLSGQADHLQRVLGTEVAELVRVSRDGDIQTRLAALYDRPESRHRQGERHRTDDAYWLYTSGTSGPPKAARHRHQDIPAAASMWADHVVGLRPRERCLSFSPVTHSYGLATGCFLPLWSGCEIVITAVTHPGALWQAIRDSGVNRLFGVPRHFASLVEDAGLAGGGHQLTSAHSSGEQLPPQLQERFEAVLGIPLLDGMGSSELFSNPISSTVTERRAGSSGRPIPGVAARLVAEGQVIVGPGRGELEVASAANAIGYWNRPAATEATFRDGYCRTGDIYDRDSDGFLFHVGRSSSRFKVFGEFVDPTRLESAALTVIEVIDAVAFESQAEHGIHACAMAVVLEDGADADAVARAVRAACADTVGHFAVPRKLYVVAALPTTHSGKLRRAGAREHAEANGRSH